MGTTTSLHTGTMKVGL